MRMIKMVSRITRRLRLAAAEKELILMEAAAPEAIARQRNVVNELRARVHADRVIACADEIARRVERQVKKAGVLA